MATDWTSIKTEYVNGAEYAELSDKYGITEANLRQRASRHKWSQDRKKASQSVTDKATAILVDNKADMLAKFNKDDLKIAQGLKSAAVKLMSGGLTPNDLRSISGTFETARRLGLSALGVDETGRIPVSEIADLPITVTIERKSARKINADTE